jgi:WXG100 family type VII secretion target
MAADRIEAQYDTLLQMSSTFSARADTLTQVVSDIRAKAEALVPQGWEGEGATAFREEFFDRVLPRLNRLIEALQSAGASTRTIHDTMKAADEQASGCFRI